MAAIRTGHPERHWQKNGDTSGLFTAKADLLACLEAITGAAMSAPTTQGAPGWYHPGRSGTIAMGPKVPLRLRYAACSAEKPVMFSPTLGKARAAALASPRREGKPS